MDSSILKHYFVLDSHNAAIEVVKLCIGSPPRNANAKIYLRTSPPTNANVAKSAAALSSLLHRHRERHRTTANMPFVSSSTNARVNATISGTGRAQSEGSLQDASELG